MSYSGPMNVVEIMTLGFLSEGPLCGYRLRKKMEQLQGYARAFSDGTIHAVTGRFVEAGYLSESSEVANGRRLRMKIVSFVNVLVVPFVCF